MEKFKNWMTAFFTKRNTFRVVVIELQIIGLLLCVVLAMSVQIDITLYGSQELTIDKGTVFQDPGAKAFADGRPVDLTVTGTVDTDVPGTYTLCYRARYLLSSKEVTRRVHVVAERAPVLTLAGAETITLVMGTDFREPGYQAEDCDGLDLTARVQVSGAVDSMEAGTYTITYTVTDDAGRSCTAQRTVVVEPAKQPEVVEPQGKVIYLTFDDGPSNYTDELLAVLAKYNVKATFFVVGSNTHLEQRLKAIADGGHSIGIHSMTHRYSEIYASEEAFLADMYGVQALIEQYTGIKTTLLRFPGGSSFSYDIMTKLVKTVTDLGFQYFDWNVDSKDAAGATTAEEVYQNVIGEIGNKQTAWVLQHDIKAYSVEAVEKIIQWGLENGYTFLPLTAQSPTWQHRTVD